MFGRTWLSSNSCVSLSGFKFGLDVLCGKGFYVLLDGRSYLFNRRKCPDQLCRNDFEVREGKSPECFFRVPCSDAI